MTLESLRCLCAIIETRSFRAAAERLHRSQPAISQQLKVLEREAGQSLIDRKSGRPTAMGALVYERGRRILEAVDSLAHEMADYESAASWCLPNCVRITGQRSFGPKGQCSFQPRATPWVDGISPQHQSPVRATQSGRYRAAALGLCRPFRAQFFVDTFFPGRCPGLRAALPLRGGMVVEDSLP